MDIGVIANRYASALLQYAKEQKQESLVYAEMQQLTTDFRQVPALTQTLVNPLLSAKEKKQLICQAATTNQALSSVFQQFAALVISHHRESFLVYMAHSYIQLYQQDKHISLGQLITAVPCSEEVSQRLEKWVEGQSEEGTDVQLETKVDPALLGGFIFRVNDQRLDASVVTQFQKIKTQFVEKNKRII